MSTQDRIDRTCAETPRIYGLPPGKINFVTFANGKVIMVKNSYAGLGGSMVPLPKN